MNNHMSLKLVGASSSLELNSPITSIYLQEELTGLTTLPGIRETKGMNIGMDGGWTSAQFYEPRLITIKGVIANQDVAVVEQRRKQLIQLLAEKRLALEFQTEAGNHYTMNVVVAGVQMPLSKVLTASYFQINLRADDPLIYDNNALAELEAILRRSSSASSGFTINFPINFQLGTSESRPTIDNFGSSVIYPTITLTGPLTTPEIVNITTNMAFTIDEVLGAGTYTASGIRGAMNQEGSVDTYSGNPIQATRDAESPISTFSLYGNAEQTTYSGKNLFPIPETRTLNGITLTHNADGTFNLTGTSTATTEFSVIVPLDQANITFGEQLTLSTTQAILPVRYYIHGSTSTGAWKQTLVGWDNPSPLTKTVAQKTADFDHIKFVINISASGTTVNYTNVKLMVEKGSSATSFEPYVGGTASPNPSFPQPISVVTGENTVKIEGKNLFDTNRTLGEPSNTAYANTTPRTFDFAEYVKGISSNNYYAPNNITSFDVSNGNITLKTTQSAYGLGFAVPVLPSTTYRISYTVTPAGGIASIGYYQKTGEWISNYSPSNGVFITPVNCAFIVVSFRGSGDNVETTYSKIQLELGSTATAYEPYHGQEFEVNLGKNLFKFAQDSGTATRSGITVEAIENGAIRVNGTVSNDAWFELMMSNFLQPIRNTTTKLFALDSTKNYTLSVRLRSGTYTESTSSTNKTNVYVQTSSTNTQKNSNLGGTATTFTGADGIYRGWMRFINGYTFNNAVLEIQLEEGSEQTSYAPYFTPIELAKIGTYQDRIYKDDGKWYIEKQIGKVVLDGTQTYMGYSNGAFTYYNFTGDGYPAPMQENTYGSSANILVISDHYTGQKTDYRGSCREYHILKTTGENSQIAWKDTRYTTTADMISWLSTHNTTVYYVLATPTTTEITEQALIDQLDAILEAHLYEGINNISNVTISPNLAGDLEIKTGQTLTVINSLSIVGSSGSAEIDLGGSELAMVGSVADELTINGTTGAVTKTARIGKIESYAGETITTDYISTSGGLDSDATIYYVLPSSSTSVINTLDSTALAAFNGVVASGGVSAQTNIGSISVDVTTVTAQDVAVVDTKQHTVTINGVGAYSKFSGDWLTLDVGLNELQLITENNTDTGSAVIKYRVGYMGV